MMPSVTFHGPVYSQSDLPKEDIPEICISGRSNVGKSSLINRLANNSKLARTSQTPGKTRSLNYYSVDDSFYLVDLPGYGYAKVPKTERELFVRLVGPYLETRVELKGLIQLIDARHGPLSGDMMMLDWLRTWSGQAVYVFTKSDKLSGNERARLVGTYRKEFGLENCILFSAHTGMGARELWAWIYRTVQS